MKTLEPERDRATIPEEPIDPGGLRSSFDAPAGRWPNARGRLLSPLTLPFVLMAFTLACSSLLPSSLPTAALVPMTGLTTRTPFQPLLPTPWRGSFSRESPAASPRTSATPWGLSVEAVLQGMRVESGGEYFDSDVVLVPIAEAIQLEVNRARQEAGVSILESREDLMAIAFLRSLDMVYRDYFDHLDPADGSAPAYTLMTSYGYSGRLAENLYATARPLDEVISSTVEAWLGSPIQRESLLDPMLAFTGVGLMGDGKWWKVTQVSAEFLP